MIRQKNVNIVRHEPIFVYDDSKKQYHGTKHYKAGDGNWYVDNVQGQKEKLKKIKVNHLI